MSKTNPTIFNIGAGKFGPLSDLNLPENRLILDIDPIYLNGVSEQDAEYEAIKWIREDYKLGDGMHVLCKGEANSFMEKTVLTFDYVTIYRYLEHVPFTDILYFIYLVSTITTPGSIVDVIVPNYLTLAQMIIDEKNPYDNPHFERDNILLTTELLNEPSCPHASIWTWHRAFYFWELENRFKVSVLSSNFEYDDRGIYLRFHAERKG